MLTGISKIPLNYFLERIKQDSTPTISILHALSGCLCLIKAIFQHSPAKEAKLVGLADMARVFWFWSSLTYKVLRVFAKFCQNY